MALQTVLGAGVLAVALVAQQAHGYDHIMSRYDGSDGAGNYDGATMFGGNGGGDWSGDDSNPPPNPPPASNPPPEVASESTPTGTDLDTGDEGNEGDEGTQGYDDQADENEGDEGNEGSGTTSSSSGGGKPKKSKGGNREYGQAKGQVQNSFRSIGSNDDDGDNGDSDGATVDGGGGGNPSSGAKQGHATFYTSMGGGGPIAACGVPIDEYKDDNGKDIPFCALNTNSEFKHGANCGRWISAEIGQVCISGTNTGDSACSDESWATRSGLTGTKLDLYVADMCPDENFWCQKDPYHIDISEQYIDDMGLMSGFNAPKLKWTYLDGPPAPFKQEKLRFSWKEGSKYAPGNYGFYATIVVINTPNGLSKVEQKVGSSWKKALKLNELGQQWEMHFPPGVGGMDVDMNFELKAYDADGACYGTYKVPFSCDGVCGDYTPADATKIGDC